MQLRTLGGLRLEGADIGRPKPLALLAYLTLEGPQDRGFLSELFWPEARDPRKSLTVALSHLRAGAPDALGADAQRAWSQVESDAGAMLRAFEEEEAERALETYVGPFLHGVQVPGAGAELEEWIYATREFLAGHAQRALTMLAEHDAAHGRRGAATRRAEAAVRLTGAAPLPPEALTRVYPLLVAGGSPLARAVVEEARELGVALPEVEAGAGDGSQRAVPSPSTRPPWASALAPLIGRERVLDELTRICRGEDRLVAVVGPAGAGKTRLVLELATRERQAGTWDDVHVVSLEALHEPEALASVVAQAVGAGPEGDDPWASLRRRLDARRTLLVLDNVEQLGPPYGALAELAASCPDATLVATSRRRLGLVAEHVVPLGGLAVPEHDELDPQTALGYGAVALFAQAARRAWPAFELRRDVLPGVLAVCRHVGGLPLAICLAASWTRMLTCDEIAAELAGGWRVLSADAADLPARQRDMRAALDGSWHRLGGRERRALMGLAAFQGPFPRAAAERVGAAGIGTLAELLDASLLERADERRYRLHPLVRLFAQEQAAARHEVQREIRERYVQYVLEAAARASRAERTGERGRRPSEVEVEDVARAWSYAIQDGRHDLLDASVEGVGWMMFKRGHVRWGERLMEHAGRVLEGVGAARANRHRATYRIAAGDARSALALLEESRDGAGHTLERAHQLRVLGVARTALERPDPDGAARDFQEALELYDAEGDGEGAVMMLNNLATLARDAERACALADRGIRLAREARQPHGLAMNLVTRAVEAVLRTGEYTLARDALQEAIDLHRATGFELPMLDACVWLGEAYLALGRLDRAAELAQGILRHCDTLEPGVAERARRVSAHVLAARVAVLHGELDAARRASDAALAGARGTDQTSLLVHALTSAARVALAEGRQAEAARDAEHAVAALESAGGGVDAARTAMRAEALRLHGMALGALERRREATPWVRRALEEAWRDGCLPATLACLLSWAGLLAGTAAGARTELLGLVAAHPASAWPTVRDAHEALRADGHEPSHLRPQAPSTALHAAVEGVLGA